MLAEDSTRLTQLPPLSPRHVAVRCFATRLLAGFQADSVSINVRDAESCGLVTSSWLGRLAHGDVVHVRGFGRTCIACCPGTQLSQFCRQLGLRHICALAICPPSQPTLTSELASYLMF